MSILDKFPKHIYHVETKSEQKSQGRYFCWKKG